MRMRVKKEDFMDKGVKCDDGEKIRVWVVGSMRTVAYLNNFTVDFGRFGEEEGSYPKKERENRYTLKS
ncbi:hypothetical protein HanRHA438_Chr00c22g0853401 [Helianthus annuus]|nr:hypothetical protein HanRHA438_Chr00c22g0853401 [Helianthus annuus]